MEDYSAFLSRAIDQSNHLQDLQTKVLVQIAKIFNITIDGSTHNQLNAKLKSKILDLFITQGEQYKDYLELPKFKNMNSNTYQTILVIFHQIWKDANKFKQQSQMTQIQKQFNYLKPQLTSNIEIQKFHLDLLDNYRKSKLCPRKTQQILIEKLNQRSFQFPFPASNSQNFSFINNNCSNNELRTKIENVQDSQPIRERQQINNNLNLNLNLSHIQAQAQVQANNPYSNVNDMYNRPPPPIPTSMNWAIMDEYARLKNQLPQKQQLPFNHDLTNYSRVNGFQNNFNHMMHNQNQNYHEDQHSSMVQEEEQKQHKNYFDIETQEVNQRFRQYMFINCYCQGKAKYQQYFQCQLCSFKIHYECFGKSEDGFMEKICPFCMLKRGNMFLMIDSSPLFQSYYVLRQGSKLQIKLSQNKINDIKHKLKENSKQIFLRFLKCSGKKSQKINNQSKFNCIQISRQFLQNFTPQKNISIEIKSSTSPQNLQEKEKILVFGLFFQKTKTIKQYVDELLNSKQLKTGYQFLENLREASQEKMITLNIIDNSSGELIVYPVRGDKCEHAEVFDYRHFLQLIKELGKQNSKDMQCDICSKKISNFLLDSYLMQKLSQIPQNNKKVIGILYKGKQDFEWKYQQQQQVQESIDDNLNEDSQQNSSVLQSQS